jgi:hypothetical protein
MADIHPSTFQIESELRRHMAREGSSQFGVTLAALLRSDRSRLTLWTTDGVVRNAEIERRFVGGENERVAVEVSQATGLRVCLGYIAEEGRRPVADAWLLDRDNLHIIDLESSRGRRLSGALGIALRHVEMSRWLPEMPYEIGRSDLQRVKLGF